MNHESRINKDLFCSVIYNSIHMCTFTYLHRSFLWGTIQLMDQIKTLICLYCYDVQTKANPRNVYMELIQLRTRWNFIF